MYTGLEEAVYRNISACKEFAQTMRSAYGPNGMNKMIINHIEKQFVTSDAGTIMRELDVEHPAAKLIVMASQMQDAEVVQQINVYIAIAGNTGHSQLAVVAHFAGQTVGQVLHK